MKGSDDETGVDTRGRVPLRWTIRWSYGRSVHGDDFREEYELTIADRWCGTFPSKREAEEYREAVLDLPLFGGGS